MLSDLAMPYPSWLEEAILKYRQKLDHVKLRPQLTALIPKIKASTHLDKQGKVKQSVAVAQAMTHRIILKIKGVLEKEGVDSDNRIPYYDYGLALDKSQRTMSFMVDRIREHKILRAKWESRGLDPDILDKLDALLIWNLTP